MLNTAKIKDKARKLETSSPDKAIEAYISILEELEGTPEIDTELALYNKVGDLYLKVSKVAEAVDMYERAVNRYTEGGFHNNAIALCNKILRNAPGRTHIYLKLAQLMVQRGFLSEAKQHFIEYADRMQKAGKVDEAFRALKEFADLSPDNEEIRLMLAEQLKAAARTEEAREQLAKMYAEAKQSGDQRRSRQTLSKIKAIDPEYDVEKQPAPKTKPRAEKSSDIVFLDLGEDLPPSRGAARGAPAAPPAPPPVKAKAPPPAPVEIEPVELEPVDLDPVAEEEEPVVVEPLPKARRSSGKAKPVVEPEEEIIDVVELEPAKESPSLELVMPEEVVSADAEPVAEEVDDEEAPARRSGSLPFLEVDRASAAQPAEADLDVADAELEITRDSASLAEVVRPEEPEILELESRSSGEESLLVERDDGALDDEITLEGRGISEDIELESLGGDVPMIEMQDEVDLGEPGVEVPDLDFGGFGEAGGLAAGETPEFDVDSIPGLATNSLDVEAVEAPDVDTIQRRVADDPDNPELHRTLAEALVESGERTRGVEELDITLQLYEAREEWDLALDVTEEILRLDPESVRHHQKRVECAFRAGDRHRLVDAYLELSDALFRSGALDRARAVYQRVLELDPQNDRALSVLATFEPAPPEPTIRNAAAPKAASGDFVDLGALILEDDDKPKDARLRVQDEEPTGDEQRDFQDMLQQFKKGIAASLGEDDAQAHYDLGVAFKEMGLLDEAIGEFQKALRGADGRLRTSEALGVCFFEKGQFPVAATVLRRAIDIDPAPDAEKIGLLYWLGRAEEEQGRSAEALASYQRVFAEDIQFEDVSSRVKSLSKAGR